MPTKETEKNWQFTIYIRNNPYTKTLHMQYKGTISSAKLMARRIGRKGYDNEDFPSGTRVIHYPAHMIEAIDFWSLDD